MAETTTTNPPVDFRTEPAGYKHWKLTFDGPVATLAMDVREDGGLRPGNELKLNSYDLGVDIELYDALQRLRFEHPEVGAVILTSGKDRVFCAGANIRMLGQSSHAWKVNFCKFTNETRNAIEEASGESKQVWLAAVNGPCAGGGYELALATEWIVMADDANTAVSLPEVPLLAVLPGTGGLTRLVDKRNGRRHRAGRPILAARGRSRARRPDPASAYQRGRDRALGLQDRGGRRHGRNLRPPAPRPPRRLVPARGAVVPQARVQAHRRLVAFDVRADRARLVLRRHAARIGPRRGPLLHAARHAAR